MEEMEPPQEISKEEETVCNSGAKRKTIDFTVYTTNKMMNHSESIKIAEDYTSSFEICAINNTDKISGKADPLLSSTFIGSVDNETNLYLAKNHHGQMSNGYICI